MTITYIALEDFTLSFPTTDPRAFLEIPLKKGQKFDFVNLDWMNWIKLSDAKPETISMIETGSREGHIFRLDHDSRCIRSEWFTSYTRDKQISKIIEE
jgi:hypothetical protein